MFYNVERMVESYESDRNNRGRWLWYKYSA